MRTGQLSLHENRKTVLPQYNTVLGLLLANNDTEMQC